MKPPKYKSQLIVHAGKIASISLRENGDAGITFEEEIFPILVRKEWLEEFKPEVGGYFTIHEDGANRFSSAKDFERWKMKKIK